MNERIIDAFDYIYNQVKQYPVFQNNTSHLLRQLNETLEIFNINVQMDLFKTIMTQEKNKNSNAELLNASYESYRTILKFIMINENTSNQNVLSDNEIRYNFVVLFTELHNKYNQIRNRVDRHKLGLLSLSFDEKTNTIIESDEYSKRRSFIRAKQILNLDRNETISSKLFLLEHFINYKSEVKKEKYTTFFHSKRDTHILDVIFKLCLEDSEIKDDVDFGDFNYFDIIKYASTLVYLSLFKIASNWIHYKEKDSNHTYRFEAKQEDFITIISDISKIGLDKTEFLTDLFTYNPVYHSEKIVLLQHLVKIDEAITFSPNLILIADISKKIYRVFNDFYRQKYEKTISKVAHLKEIRMIDGILKLFQNTEVVIKSNFKYKLNDSKKNVAEYDLVLYDKVNKTLALCECKWFYVGDGEYEHAKLNKKIIDTIKDRKHKDLFVHENKSDFMKKCFNLDDEYDIIYSFIISNNYEGDFNFDFSYPVIDMTTFKHVSKREDFNLLKMKEAIFNEDYYDLAQFEYIPIDFEYFGIKFRLVGNLIKDI